MKRIIVYPHKLVHASTIKKTNFIIHFYKIVLVVSMRTILQHIIKYHKILTMVSFMYLKKQSLINTK